MACIDYNYILRLLQLSISSPDSSFHCQLQYLCASIRLREYRLGDSAIACITLHDVFGSWEYFASNQGQ